MVVEYEESSNSYEYSYSCEMVQHPLPEEPPVDKQQLQLLQQATSDQQRRERNQYLRLKAA
jgi:hypothetical protein